MVIDTEDEMSRRPTANPRGFFSGLAKATIERKDDALFDASLPGEGRKRDAVEAGLEVEVARWSGGGR